MRFVAFSEAEICKSMVRAPTWKRKSFPMENMMRIGNYEVLDRADRNEIGNVFRAISVEEKDERLYAMKVFPNKRPPQRRCRRILYTASR